MDPRISFITLGVSDLSRARDFYAQVLGLPQMPTPPTVAFFRMGPTVLALWPRTELAADAGLPEAAGQASGFGDCGGFGGFALAHNVRSPAEVDALLAHVGGHGGRVTKPGQPTFWGGYAGYFADPDGFLWEVAYNPDIPIP